MRNQDTKLWSMLLAAIAGLSLTVAPLHAQTAEDQPAETTASTSGEESSDNQEAAADGGAGEGAALAEDGEVIPGEEEALTEGGEALAEEDEALLDEETARDWGRFQPLADLVDAGGPVILILMVLSIISLMVILVKLIQFRLLRVGDHRFTEKVSTMLANGRDKDALELLERRRGVIARVMETALRGKSQGADEDKTRQETERVAKAKLDGLEQGLPLLNLIATVSPLLGLLGTVLGMIEAFQQLENAGDRVDPAILSGGIWEALLTTAAGLTVAIPAAAFFTWLQRSVDVAAQHMEDAAIRVFTASLYSTVGTKKSDDS